MGAGATEVGVPEWVSTQPEDLRDSLKGYESQEAALRDISALKAKLSQTGLKAPEEGAEASAWEDYYKARRGGISDPANYTFVADEKALDGLGMSKGEYDSLSKMLFDKGIPDDVHATVMNSLTELTKTEVARLQNARVVEQSQTRAALEREWGKDAYAKNINSVNALLQKYPDVSKAIAENGLGANKALIEMLYSFAQDAQEGGFGGGEEGRGDPEALLKSLLESPEYRDINHPGHRAAMKRELQLYERIAVQRMR